MPRSLYLAIRNAYPSEGKEIVFSRMIDQSSFYTDYQVKEYFLCGDCENRLNKYGEGIVSSECHKGEGKFRLLEKIKAATPFATDGTEKWINPASDPTFYSKEYLYFGASIIWRASAGKWSDGLDSYQNSLGPKYQEQLRKFLVGESEFPDNVYLGVYADNDIEILPLISFPTVNKKSGYHHHTFYIPGIKFSFLIGASVGGIKQLSATYRTKIFFIEYSFNSHPDYKFIHKETKYTLKPKGRLADELNRRNSVNYQRKT